MSLRLVLAHWKLQTLYQLRAPSFVVPVFIYLALFYLNFALSEASSEALAKRFMVSSRSMLSRGDAPSSHREHCREPAS